MAETPDEEEVNAATTSPLRSFLLVGVGATGGALAVVGQLVDAGRPSEGPVALTAAVAMTFIPSAAFVLARLPGPPLDA